jgi:hypothetical protein
MDRICSRPPPAIDGRACSRIAVLLIDAANVVGSRPTGWWRDRPGAARDLVRRVRAATAAGQLPGPVSGPVVVVLEGAARRGVAEGLVDDVLVVHAPGGGDDTMAAVAAEVVATDPATNDAAGAREQVLLVSADRELGRRVEAIGGRVTTPGWLLARLGPAAPLRGPPTLPDVGY